MPDPDLRALVVDDEPLAREEICYLLEEMGGVAVVAQAGNGPDAVEAVNEHEPDLVFLDVQMPGLTGFEVARRLVASGPPVAIVFVTAYDQHAIEAFEVNAVDYLLKPVDSGRLETAVQRVRQRRSTSRPLNDQLERIVQLVEQRQGRREQVAVKVGERYLLVQAD
ncbi:MAG TPA: response regulator, partial [Vicinamibacterales bacterium]|nr:response regulator [Vicinamibacterales bacterium]